ncbi:MAG TPA: DNA repair protein RecO [Usitatibacter sp.]|nr:DNA repair protein RecO [Usitatibacter sp.]
MDKGYVLHSYPYRETSLILQVWTEKHGRLGLVAKGARRPKSPSRSVLVPFQPLALDWFGRGELRTLKTAEPAVPATPLGGGSLLSAFYLNELLLKLTTRDDPHEGLFTAYDEAIARLRALSRASAVSGVSEPAPHAPRDIEPVLRRFELRLLQELGYAVELAREAGAHRPIEAHLEYYYVVERGPIRAAEGDAPPNAIRLNGQTLMDLERGRFDSPTTAAQSKQLMRILIHHSLNGQELATRSLVRDLQRIDEAAP